jgi:RNA polymerase sigma-70 factor (ECF subfamily)
MERKVHGVEALDISVERESFWKAAYEEHGPAVLGFLRSRTGSREDAEELLHETFVRAMKAGTADSSQKVRGYLFTTAHNLLRNRARRARVSPLIAAPDGVEYAADGAVEMRARLRSLCDRIAVMMADMSPAHQTAFALGVLERLPYRDIADRTGWSLSQVKVNIHRARRRAMAELEDFLPTTEEVRQ